MTSSCDGELIAACRMPFMAPSTSRLATRFSYEMISIACYASHKGSIEDARGLLKQQSPIRIHTETRAD